MTRLRCAILDDYLNLSLKVADWSKVEDRVDVTVFNQPFASQEAAVSALKDFEIILRDARAHAVSARDVRRLPKLKLLITSGMRNNSIDMAAAKDKQVVVCGTQWPRDPTAPLTMGMILELTRNIGRENARMHAGEYLQKHVGIEIEGKTLGVVGLGKLGAKVAATCESVRHERDRLEPEPDGRTLQGSRRRAMPPRRSCSRPPTSSPSMWC